MMILLTVRNAPTDVAVLQIETDLVFIITSTADELSGATNIDDLERH